jgi:hypothetical protein
MNWRTATRRLTTAAVAAVVSIGATGIGTAGAQGGQRTLASGLAGPLQIDVSRQGVLVGQSFAGLLSVVDRQGTVTTLLGGQAIDGVAWRPGGSTLFTYSDFDSLDEQGVADTELRIRRPNGSVHTLADLRAHEKAENPDGGQTYGFQGLDADCLALLPPDQGVTPYNGILDSHPYALATHGTTTYIAEAGGNAILAVDGSGHVRTVAVLPPHPLLVTQEIADSNDFPACTVGKTFNFEAVPTDVEIHDGSLYVSTLPGGPEDPSLGARGSVFKVNPNSGKVRQLATGFLGGANLAVSPSGTIYVAELFGGQISRVSQGGAVPVKSIAEPAALEWWHGRLYVGADVFADGKIVTFTP